MARTESTKSLLWRVARKLGMSPSDDPTVNNLTDDQARPILGYIHEGAKMAWESWDWQDVCVIEQRWYADPYTAGTNYAQGSYVYDPANGIYYQNLYGGDPGQPTLFPGAWAQVTLIGQVNLFTNPYLLDAPLLSPSPPPPPNPPSNLITIPAVVPNVQTGKTEIDTVFSVFATDPRNQSYPIEVSYRISSRGVELMATQLTNVWIHFRPPFPGIGTETWLSTTSYSVNDSVYYTVDGNTYIALVANSNVTPGSDGGVTWAKFQIPRCLASGVVTYAYAMALEEDGQDDKGQVQYNKAEGQLVREYDKQQTQQGQQSRFSVRIA